MGVPQELDPVFFINLIWHVAPLGGYAVRLAFQSTSQQRGGRQTELSGETFQVTLSMIASTLELKPHHSSDQII